MSVETERREIEVRQTALAAAAAFLVTGWTWTFLSEDGIPMRVPDTDEIEAALWRHIADMQDDPDRYGIDSGRLTTERDDDGRLHFYLEVGPVEGIEC